MRLKIVALLAAVLLAAVPLRAQTNPTGTISGKVVDQEGLPVPGATVTVQSPAMQGSRSATTSAKPPVFAKGAISEVQYAMCSGKAMFQSVGVDFEKLDPTANTAACKTPTAWKV